MRCPDCRGDIEGVRPFCPHCGRKFDGLLTTLASTLSPDKGKGPKAQRLPLDRKNPQAQAQLDDLRRRVAENPVAMRFVVGAVGGAIVGGFIPGVNWFVGALVGLFIVFRTLGKTK